MDSKADKSDKSVGLKSFSQLFWRRAMLTNRMLEIRIMSISRRDGFEIENLRIKKSEDKRGIQSVGTACVFRSSLPSSAVLWELVLQAHKMKR